MKTLESAEKVFELERYLEREPSLERSEIAEPTSASNFCLESKVSFGLSLSSSSIASRFWKDFTEQPGVSRVVLSLYWPAPPALASSISLRVAVTLP